MVQPIELPDVLSKTPAAERVAESHKASTGSDQHQAAMTVAAKAQQAQRKQIPPQHSDEVVLHNDEESQGKKERKAKTENPVDGDDANDPLDGDPAGEQPRDRGEPNSPSHLDVTV